MSRSVAPLELVEANELLELYQHAKRLEREWLAASATFRAAVYDINSGGRGSTQAIADTLGIAKSRVAAIVAKHREGVAKADAELVHVDQELARIDAEQAELARERAKLLEQKRGAPKRKRRAG